MTEPTDPGSAKHAFILDDHQENPDARYRWTLITVAYNSAEALAEHWAGVQLPTDVEWVVVDNASSDCSAAVAADLGARVICLETNQGFGAANNVAFRNSDSRYVAFVNPDVTIDPLGLRILEAAIESGGDCLAAPQLVYPNGQLQPNGRGKPYLWWKILHRLRPERVSAAYQRFALPGETVRVDWLIGAVVAGTRPYLATLGPWDERYFVYYEDSDLGLRNAMSGGTSVVVGDAQWVHSWARATGSLSWSAWKLELASMTKFYARFPRYLLPRRCRQ